jgi:branched-chain amino acid transport system substrate-binding protein
MRKLSDVLCLLFLISANHATFADDRPLRIGLTSDQSGQYADFQGPGSVLAARMAVEDYGGKAAGRKVEVVANDDQNKVDIAVSTTHRWFDNEGVDAIVDAANSGIALAISQLAKEKNKVFLVSGAASSDLTGARCNPNTIHWTYDNWAYSNGLSRIILENGGKTWFFITVDYAFGKDLEARASAEVTARGGKVLGSVRHPIGSPDFSSYLLQAQASGADVIAFANAGGDSINAFKQAAEFGLKKKHKLVGFVFGINNVAGLGLESSAGAYILNPFYWDRNERTRAWAKRFQERHPAKNMPNDMQAGVYSSVIHYLKAVDKVGGSADGAAVVAAMKAIPTDDPLFGKGLVRADGRKIHPMYLLQVKEKAESKGKWDFFNIVQTIPGDLAFRPLSQSNCPLVSKQ